MLRKALDDAQKRHDEEKQSLTECSETSKNEYHVVVDEPNNNNNNVLVPIHDDDQRHELTALIHHEEDLIVANRYGAMVAAATSLSTVITSNAASSTTNGNNTTTNRIQQRKGSHSATSSNSTSINNNENIEDDDDHDGTYEEEEEYDDDDDDEGSIGTIPWYQKVWDNVVTGILVVANVENLWDTPPSSPISTRTVGTTNTNTATTSHTSSHYRGGILSASSSTRTSTASVSSDGDHANNNNNNSNNNDNNYQKTIKSVLYELYLYCIAKIEKKNTIVLFWFVVLATSYATERSTFKLIVDRMDPFRLVTVQFITGMHAILLYLCMILFQTSTSQTNNSNTNNNHHHTKQSWSFGGTNTNDHPKSMPLGIPYSDVCFMGILDSISLLLVFITGSHVPPTLTVILVQFTIPLTAFLTQFIHPDGRWNCFLSASSKLFRVNESDDDVDDDDEVRVNDNHTSVPSGSNHSNVITKDTPTPTPPPPPPPAQLGIGDTSSNSSQVNTANTATKTTTSGTADNTSTINSRNGGSHHHHPSTTTPLESTPAAQQQQQQQQQGTAMPGYGGLSLAHVWGSLIISLAVLLALVPALYSLANPTFFIYADTIPIRTATNTLLFVLSCFPSAASQLYKESVLVQYKQPINVNYLNLLLSMIQFVIAVMVAPLLFPLQGIGALSGNNGNDEMDHEVFVDQHSSAETTTTTSSSITTSATAADGGMMIDNLLLDQQSLENVTTSRPNLPSVLLSMLIDTATNFSTNATTSSNSSSIPFNTTLLVGESDSVLMNTSTTTTTSSSNINNINNMSYFDSTNYDDWTSLYPSSTYRMNYIDSIKCLFNVLESSDQDDKYPEYALCNGSFGLLLLHCLSIIAVGVAVDKIVNAGATKVMYRGISAGIIVAVIGMRYYDLHLPDFNYGPIISALNLVCVMLLIIGSEIYHRVSLPESTFETIYPEIQFHTNEYDD